MVAQGREAVAADRPQQLHDDVGVDRRFLVGRIRVRAAHAGEHLGDDRAARGPVRGDQAGMLMRVGDGGERRADRGQRQTAPA